ncbi:hypothetical protein B4U80_13377 [Leptotrombidium deliense]|uniref:C2H2-type domain-containing protein n=1 Tax=Leptotrombidium deliense TaxID=299467 RepID=A0A443S7G5_9ACAR|nr:hypothetical protein B4U80_13377 [Leptotrombidium deliense]
MSNYFEYNRALTSNSNTIEVELALDFQTVGAIYERFYQLTNVGAECLRFLQMNWEQMLKQKAYIHFPFVLIFDLFSSTKFPAVESDVLKALIEWNKAHSLFDLNVLLRINQIRNVQKEIAVVTKMGSDIIVCRLCDRKFACKMQAFVHVDDFHFEKKYRCSLCEEELFNELDFSRHVQDIHMNSDNLLCETCGKIYTTFEALEAHKKSDHQILKCKVEINEIKTPQSSQKYNVIKFISAGKEMYSCKTYAYNDFLFLSFRELKEYLKAFDHCSSTFVKEEQKKLAKSIVEDFNNILKETCGSKKAAHTHEHSCERVNDVQKETTKCYDRFSLALAEVYDEVHPDHKLDAECCLHGLYFDCIRDSVKPICGEDYAKDLAHHLRKPLAVFYTQYCTKADCKEHKNLKSFNHRLHFPRKNEVESHLAY